MIGFSSDNSIPNLLLRNTTLLLMTATMYSITLTPYLGLYRPLASTLHIKLRPYNTLRHEKTLYCDLKRRDRDSSS